MIEDFIQKNKKIFSYLNVKDWILKDSLKLRKIQTMLNELIYGFYKINR